MASDGPANQRAVRTSRLSDLAARKDGPVFFGASRFAKYQLFPLSASHEQDTAQNERHERRIALAVGGLCRGSYSDYK